MKKILLGSALTLLLWASYAPVSAQGNPPPNPKQQIKLTELEAEYITLSQDYNKAEKRYEKAETEAERTKVQLKDTKHPVEEFLPKFQSLAERAKGKEVGAKALLWVVQSRPFPKDDDNNPANQAFKNLMTDYLQSPTMEQLAQFLSWANFGSESKIEVALKAFHKMESESKSRTVRAAALFYRGMLLRNMRAGQRQEIQKIHIQLQKEYSDTWYAKKEQLLNMFSG